MDRKDELFVAQQIIATGMARYKRGNKMLKSLPKDSRYWKQTRAILYTIRARDLIEQGQFTAAGVAVEQAENTAPDLLEVHLARAELLAQIRFDGLTKTAAQDFRATGTFRYPQGRINRYGEALAEISWVRSEYKAEAIRDPLRGPEFANRLELLQSDIKTFYPFDADYLQNEEPVLTLRLPKKAKKTIEVTVTERRGKKHKISVKPGKGSVVKLARPGLVKITVEGKELALFAEPFTAITAEI